MWVPLWERKIHTKYNFKKQKKLYNYFKIKTYIYFIFFLKKKRKDRLMMLYESYVRKW